MAREETKGEYRPYMIVIRNVVTLFVAVALCSIWCPPRPQHGLEEKRIVAAADRKILCSCEKQVPWDAGEMGCHVLKNALVFAIQEGVVVE